MNAGFSDWYLKDPRWWSCPTEVRIPSAPRARRVPGNSAGQRNSCEHLGFADSTRTPAWWWRLGPGTPDSQKCQISEASLKIMTNKWTPVIFNTKCKAVPLLMLNSVLFLTCKLEVKVSYLDYTISTVHTVSTEWEKRLKYIILNILNICYEREMFWKMYTFIYYHTQIKRFFLLVLLKGT